MIVFRVAYDHEPQTTVLMSHDVKEGKFSFPEKTEVFKVNKIQLRSASFTRENPLLICCLALEK